MCQYQFVHCRCMAKNVIAHLYVCLVTFFAITYMYVKIYYSLFANTYFLCVG